MVSRCSVFGCKFDDEPDVEETTEEQDGQKVTRVRRTQTCSRCGEEEVLGEYTRVTASRNESNEAEPSEVTVNSEDEMSAATPTTTATSADANKTATDGGHTHTPDGDDAIFIDSDEEGGSASEERNNTSDSDSLAADSTTAVDEEDAIIFDEDEESSERTESSQDSFNGADETTDEGVLLEDGPGFDDSDVEASPDMDEVEPADGDQGVIIMSRPSDDPEPVEDTDSTSETDSQEPMPVEAQQEPEPEPEVRCSDCEYAPPANANPLRPGDGCPDCGGWLEDA